MKLHYKACDEISSVQADFLDELTQTNHIQQVKSFILNVKWLSNVSLFIAIVVDTSEMLFYKKKDFHLHKIIQNTKTEDCCLSGCLPACLSVCLVNE